MKKYLTIGAILTLLIAIIFFSGYYTYKKTHKPLEPLISTIYIHDTITHHIVDTFPCYIAGKDSIIYRTTEVYKDVDTSAILKDYFAIHYYTRIWEDSTLKVTLEDAIAENKSINNSFDYELLKPQTIINKTYDYSTHYDKYVYFGLDMPVFPFKANRDISNINYIGLETLFCYPKGYIKANWQPYAEIVSFGFGARIAKFRK